jgi:hypothetical protein
VDNVALSPPYLAFHRRFELWVGIRIARRIGPVWFCRWGYLGMLLTRLKLTWDGFVA